MRPYLLLITLTATLGGLLFGYDTAVISGTVESLKSFFIDPYNLSETAANSRLGLIVSAALLGCIIGGLSGGWLSRILGRKKGLMIAAILFLVSAIGSAMPEIFVRPIGEGDHTFIWNFVVYRLIGGIGVGMASMMSPMYIAEIAPAKKRGKLVSFNQLAIITGMLIVYFVNYWIARHGTDTWLHETGWRWMFASEAIPALLFLILVFFIPETPRFLALKGREEKAMGVLRRINGEDKANEILSDIRESLNKVNQSGKLFSYGVLVIMVGLAIAIFQQMIGINVIMYYAPVIFKDMGAETNASLLSTIYVGVVNLVFTILAIMMVDKLGRKPLLKGGAIIMAVAMLTVGFIFYFGLSQANIDGEQVNQFANQGSAIAAFVFILIFIAGFAISWGPVAWVLLSELFPNKIRGQAMALATATLWVSNWIISWTFPIMNNSSYLIDKFNHGFAYWIYGVIGVLAAIFVSKFVPETKGKTLEQLESLWRK
ncbi:MAG: D-xylose transporter XylE [Bacteroidetes bacterium]|jgi:MFS transporter, SP family, xylose:H+ symportor|nr:D-xylose transporter XylE [Bacteroidota bacterium]MBT3750602.1 D-xylose transporter XylE [Bacteroidota bacterium]MBT4401004.1 D-xylose transporter XylE [Bacteroidota bacterium]MBT4408264.1 D-xylose transporter XylE [Bacteroidota bacterium]MBT7093879.1 D-xylose transporter XylE [Bacteroidota bacterium]